MSELFVAGADIGASNIRAGVFTLDGDLVGWEYGQTQIDDYDRSIGWTAATVDQIARQNGGLIVGASLGVAAEVTDGALTKAEDLTPWLGRRPGTDFGVSLEELEHPLDPYTTGAENDMVVIARSQVGINENNNTPIDGAVVTWSSGFNDATYTMEGRVQADEEGHEYLRPGAKCGCGEDGHVGAHVSGNGIANNTGVPMAEWLRDPDHRSQIVTDVSTATVAMIERHARDRSIHLEELRWTGGVALGNPDLVFLQVASRVRKAMGSEAPAFETVTMGDLAGMHGAAMAARMAVQAA